MSQLSGRLLFSVVLCLVVASAPAYALCNKRFSFKLRVPAPVAKVNSAKIQANMVDHGRYGSDNNFRTVFGWSHPGGVTWPSYNTLSYIRANSRYRSPRYWEVWEVLPQSMVNPVMRHGQRWRKFVFPLRGSCAWKRQYWISLRYQEFWDVAYWQGNKYHVWRAKPKTPLSFRVGFPGNNGDVYTRQNYPRRTYIQHPSGYNVLYDQSLKVDCRFLRRSGSASRSRIAFCYL